ncbi:MAG: phospholipase [Solirubrobacterales bacterium]|nr:phospholipase [Solirubrobacterales bacterium]
MEQLINIQRPASGEPEGLLVLHHGRGSDENDLIGIADLLTLDGWPGNHWYIVPRVGHPDPASFAIAYQQLSDFHEQIWQETGIAPDRTILGGFSMGSVMSFATGLGDQRPVVAGILGLSGFIPTVDGWQPNFVERTDTSVLIAHGTEDPVISIEFARAAKELIEASDLELEYHEAAGGHQINPNQLPLIVDWIDRTLPR